MGYTYSAMGYANPDAVTQIATGYSTTTFVYDNNGNVTQKIVDGTTTTYVYDYANRLTALGVLGATTTYKLPPNIPAANFWSVTLYEAENASGLANGQPFRVAALRSEVRLLRHQLDDRDGRRMADHQRGCDERRLDVIGFVLEIEDALELCREDRLDLEGRTGLVEKDESLVGSLPVWRSTSRNLAVTWPR